MLTKIMNYSAQIAHKGSVNLNDFYQKDGIFALTKVADPTNKILNLFGVHYFDKIPQTTEPLKKVLYAVKFFGTIDKDWKKGVPRYKDGGISWVKVCGLASEISRTGGWLKANCLISWFPVPSSIEKDWKANKTFQQIPGWRSLCTRPEEFFGLLGSLTQIKRYAWGDEECNTKSAFLTLTACVGRVFLIVFSYSWEKGKQWQKTTLLVVNFTVQLTSVLSHIVKKETERNDLYEKEFKNLSKYEFV